MPTSSSPTRPGTAWVDRTVCDLDDFASQVAQRTDLADYPHAAGVRDNVLIYPAAQLAGAAARDAREERARPTPCWPPSPTT